VVLTVSRAMWAVIAVRKLPQKAARSAAFSMSSGGIGFITFGFCPTTSKRNASGIRSNVFCEPFDTPSRRRKYLPFLLCSSAAVTETPFGPVTVLSSSPLSYRCEHVILSSQTTTARGEVASCPIPGWARAIVIKVPLIICFTIPRYPFKRIHLRGMPLLEQHPQR